MAQPLSDTVIAEMLRSLKGWKLDSDKLNKEFTFDNFSEALSFIVKIGVEAEKQGHHPEIFNVYNKVNISLSTHDAGDKVTDKDVELAKAIENILQ